MDVGGFLLGDAVSQLFCGPLADRFGCRPILLAGIGACVGPILCRAVIRDVFDREQAAGIFSAMTIIISVASLIASSLGGFRRLLSDGALRAPCGETGCRQVGRGLRSFG
jgi:DHA1 family bicyclomycin/chloramphenicol resistance-like MFS transporter